MTDQPSVLAGIFGKPFAEQVTFFRQKLGNLVPTAKWDDISKSAHDRGFMVAGAAKADLLADLAAAVDKAIHDGQSIDAFRKDFANIVKQRGWRGWTGSESAGGRAWRTRTIYTTNASTSYAAGRLAQLRDGGYPLYVYRHNDSVQHPRPQHLAWNGLTLPAGHQFWQTHYPPNGWGCHCYVVGARSATGAKRLGGDAGKELPDGWDAISQKTGEPAGIDKGWGYAPGNTVTDMISAMAKKATAWEPDLANAFIGSMPESMRASLASAYQDLLGG